MRVAVYDDQVYRRAAGELWTERTSPLFIAEVGAAAGGLVLLGRLDPDEKPWNFRMPEGLEFVGLPFYPSLAAPLQVARAFARSIAAFWGTLGRVDAVWLLGPHPLAIFFAVMAALRGKRIALGVRQDLRQYARSRHPGRRSVHVLADLLEGAWRLLGRLTSVVVVGPELARHYSRSRRLLTLYVSLVREADIAGPDVAQARAYEGPLQILTVGRVDTEKNPLLLADVLARLDERWRLVVCGTGPMEDDLGRRLEELGVADRADLRGYVPVDGGLLDLYRESDVFLHVSWTEGVPQVLFEAFASRLPVVATAVGGIPDVTGDDAALLVPPGDPEAAVTALSRVAGEPALRERLIEAGLERISGRTLEAQARRVAAFLRG